MRKLATLFACLTAIVGSAAGAEDFTPENTIPPKVENFGIRIADLARDNVQATLRHFKNWWDEGSLEHAPPQDVPTSYCYRAQSDVMCYSQPMPGWEHRLIGYQGTDAAPPPPVVMKLLPTPSEEDQTLAAGTANRIAATQPVFLDMPMETKEEPPVDTAVPLAPENVHENITTDPALAPEL